MSTLETCPHDGAACVRQCRQKKNEENVWMCVRKAQGLDVNQRGSEAPGVKADYGKPQYRLIPPRGLAPIVAVLTYGAHKYAPDNWKNVPQARERYADALLRHVFAWLEGEKLDPESGLHHLAHAGCCVLFLLHFEGAEEDA